VKFELSRLAEYTEPEIVAELQRIAASVPAHAPLTKVAFNKLAKVDASTVGRRFGSWEKALKAAGLADRYSGRTVSGKMKVQLARAMSNEDMLAELRRVAGALGNSALTHTQFNANSEIAAAALSSRFGSWGAALKAAGIAQGTLGRRYSESDYFENLLNVWTHYGRQPSYSEMNHPPSGITAGGYEKRWGTWRKALTAFIEAVNSDAPITATDIVTEQPEIKSKRLAPEDRKKIPLGLRYFVLRRDNFKCVICGSSPATDPTCILHVDHIIAFSLGGKTVASNLRTLCMPCNVGKSNK
jgi:hypothetical protein